MNDLHLECQGPLAPWIGPLAVWLVASGYPPERARRTVLAFERLSSWLARCGVSLVDLNDRGEDFIDEYIRVEQLRSGSRFTAAFQYLPLAKRFLVSQGVLRLRDRAGRSRGGLPRLPAGPLAGLIVDLVTWLRVEGYSDGTASSVACTFARLGAWMARTRSGVEGLDEALLQKFVAAQERGRVRHPSSRRRIVTVRKFLDAAGLLDPPRVATPALTPVEEALQAWGQFERDEHGLGPRWVREQHGWVRVDRSRFGGHLGLAARFVGSFRYGIDTPELHRGVQGRCHTVVATAAS